MTRLLSPRKLVTVLFALVLAWMASGAWDELRAMRCQVVNVTAPLTVRAGEFSSTTLAVGQMEVCR